MQLYQTQAQSLVELTEDPFRLKEKFKVCLKTIFTILQVWNSSSPSSRSRIIVSIL